MVETDGTDSTVEPDGTASSVGETTEIPVELLSDVLDELLSSVAGLLTLLPQILNDIELVAEAAQGGDNENVNDAAERLLRVVEGFEDEGNES